MFKISAKNQFMVGVVTSSLTRTGENCLLDMIICLRQGQRESLYCKEILGTEHLSHVDCWCWKVGWICFCRNWYKVRNWMWRQPDRHPGIPATAAMFYFLFIGFVLAWLDDGDKTRPGLSVSVITVVLVQPGLSRSTRPLSSHYNILYYIIVYYTTILLHFIQYRQAQRNISIKLKKQQFNVILPSVR